MAIVTVNMTKMTFALGMDQSMIAQPIALVIDMRIEVSVNPLAVRRGS